MGFLAALPSLSRAHTSEEILSFAITNYTGYVINSDAGNTNSAFDRDAIRAQGSVYYCTTNPPDPAMKRSAWRPRISY